MHISNVEAVSHLPRTHLLQKLTPHCCQTNHKLPDAQGLLGTKEIKRGTARALNLSTCQATSPAGLCHWSQCRCVNLYHLGLGPMCTEQPLCHKSSPSHTSNSSWKLCVSPLHNAHIWPYPAQRRHPLSSSLCATSLFCLHTSKLPMAASQ